MKYLKKDSYFRLCYEESQQQSISSRFNFSQTEEEQNFVEMESSKKYYYLTSQEVQ
jgi:hypothetical protein